MPKLLIEPKKLDEEIEVTLSLEQLPSGNVVLKAAGSEGVPYSLLVIHHNGNVGFVGFIPESLGFKTNSCGELLVAED